MDCLPLKTILQSFQIETLKLRKSSSESLESLPRDDLFTRVSDWLEDKDNEIDNISYREEYDENQKKERKFEENKIQRTICVQHYFHYEEERIIRTGRKLTYVQSPHEF